MYINVIYIINDIKYIMCIIAINVINTIIDIKYLICIININEIYLVLDEHCGHQDPT